MKSISFLFCTIFIIIGLPLTAQNRWSLEKDGGISWEVKKNDIHTDHIEMSGKHVSVILTYGTDNTGSLVSNKLLVFPMLRTIPNNTTASLLHTFGKDALPIIKINDRIVSEQPLSFYLKGIWKSTSDMGYQCTMSRELTPSVDKPYVIEKCVITNNGDKNIKVDVENFEKISRTHRENSFYDIYEIKAEINNSGVFN